MAATSNSEALPFLEIDTPLFADGFPDNSSDVSTVESVAREDEEFIIEAIIVDKPDPCGPDDRCYVPSGSSGSSWISPGFVWFNAWISEFL
jgi:hypothetical protein